MRQKIGSLGRGRFRDPAVPPGFPFNIYWKGSFFNGLALLEKRN